MMKINSNKIHVEKPSIIQVSAKTDSAAENSKLIKHFSFDIVKIKHQRENLKIVVLKAVGAFLIFSAILTSYFIVVMALGKII